MLGKVKNYLTKLASFWPSRNYQTLLAEIQNVRFFFAGDTSRWVPPVSYEPDSSSWHESLHHSAQTQNHFKTLPYDLLVSFMSRTRPAHLALCIILSLFGFTSIFVSAILRLLAGRDRKWPGFWSFGDTHLHLTRGRVPESFWKPHQSKALNFLHRNYKFIFFSTPKKNVSG